MRQLTMLMNSARLLVKVSSQTPMLKVARIADGAAPVGLREPPPKRKGNMEGQLVAGQWVEVSMEDLQTPVLLSGFVLSMRPSEVLLTFPDLLAPPQGLESEA